MCPTAWLPLCPGHLQGETCRLKAQQASGPPPGGLPDPVPQFPSAQWAGPRGGPSCPAHPLSVSVCLCVCLSVWRAGSSGTESADLAEAGRAHGWHFPDGRREPLGAAGGRPVEGGGSGLLGHRGEGKAHPRRPQRRPTRSPFRGAEPLPGSGARSERPLEEGRAAGRGSRAFVWRPLPSPPPIVPGAGSPRPRLPRLRAGWVRVQAPPPRARRRPLFRNRCSPAPPLLPASGAPWWWRPGPAAAGGAGAEGGAAPRAGAGDVAPSWDRSGRWCSGCLWGGLPRVHPTFPLPPCPGAGGGGWRPWGGPCCGLELGCLPGCPVVTATAPRWACHVGCGSGHVSGAAHPPGPSSAVSA